MKDLTPLVDEMRKYNDYLDHPKAEIESLIKEKEAEDKIARKGSNCYSFNSKMKNEIGKDVEETLKEVSNILEMINQENCGQRITCLPPQSPEFVVGINENNHRQQEKQQGSVSFLLSIFLKLCINQTQQRVNARTLCISTDGTFTTDLCNTQLTETEVLILNVRNKHCSLPEYTEKMSKLMVMIIFNCDIHSSELKKFGLLGSLPNLSRIRLEKVSVPCLGVLKNLRKLSLYMCDTSQAFESSVIPISDALPNLVYLNIDYCKDMVELPSGLCDIKPLQKLSISNCHKFSALPQEIGKLGSLELLRLNSCTDLEGLPDSIGRLSKLRLLDISNCISLKNLPEDIGNVQNLKKVYMRGCSRCELPMSIMNLEHLKSVTCDEETAASWEDFKAVLPNLRIEVPHEDVNLNWLLGTSSRDKVVV